MKNEIDENTIRDFERETLGRGTWMRGVLGNVLFIRGDFKDEDICALCGALSSVLCDTPVGLNKTCDMPLCEDCAKTIDDDIHVCPAHFNQEGYSRHVFINKLPNDGVADNKAYA